MACRVVMSILGRLHGNGHVVVIDNCFSSINLFTKLKNLRSFNRINQGIYFDVFFLLSVMYIGFIS